MKLEKVISKMDIKSEEDVLDELKSANLFIPPEITITPVSSFMPYDASSSNFNKPQQQQATTAKRPSSSTERSKYAQLLNIIEEIGKDIRPSYTGSKSSSERLKRGIMNARVLVRECLSEVERSARQ